MCLSGSACTALHATAPPVSLYSTVLYVLPCSTNVPLTHHHIVQKRAQSSPRCNFCVSRAGLQKKLELQGRQAAGLVAST